MGAVERLLERGVLVSMVVGELGLRIVPGGYSELVEELELKVVPVGYPALEWQSTTEVLELTPMLVRLLRYQQLEAVESFGPSVDCLAPAGYP